MVQKVKEVIFCYKQTLAVNEDGRIESVATNSANVHDSKTLAVVLSFLPKEKKKQLYAEKGFQTL